MTDFLFSIGPTRLRAVTLGVCLSLGLGAMSASAQVRRDLGASPRLPGMGTDLKARPPATAGASDYIVAVVNSEVITNIDVEKRIARIKESAQRGGGKLPAADVLRQQVLDSLIDEKAQLAYAKTSGVDVPDAELDNTIEGIAAQNQLSVDELKRRLQAEGMDYQRYRNTLRDQMLLQRVREREVNKRIVITDDELDDFLKSEPAALTDPALNLAHILIAVPEKATAQQVQALQAKAESIQQRAAQGVNFAQLAKENSDEPTTRDQGGVIGMRGASRLPDLFVQAVQGVKVGQVAPLIRSNAGFHILKVVQREDNAQATYTEQRARHILLRTTPQTKVADLVKRLSDIRQQIMSGQASFAQMARQYSEDGSASRGGDLGWSAPGQFVPEFEKALSALQPGQISEPVVSRFGVHLIQLTERREVKLSDAQKREVARNVLRERKYEAAYEDWAKEVRASAWVDLREAP